MAYSKERASKIETKDIKYIPVGINENVKLKSAKVETSLNGNTFLEITFEKDGATLTQTEWKPTLGGFVTTQDQLQEREDRQFSRMLQILHCFYADEMLNFSGSSFEEFAAWVVAMLNGADKSKLLRVKVVYNNKGYTTLPGYSKYTFIEPMVLPEGKTSAIAILGIDNMQKPVIADAETPVDPLSTTVEQAAPIMNSLANDPASDLPF